MRLSLSVAQGRGKGVGGGAAGTYRRPVAMASGRVHGAGDEEKRKRDERRLK
jgi:hypothetical protein